MTNEMKRAYITKAYWRYQKSSKSEKSAILDEFCEICDYSRKHAIRVFNDPPVSRVKPSGPKKKYGHEVEKHLLILWKKMNQMGSKKMVAAFPFWLPFYKDVDPLTKKLLHEISASTIDRILKPYKDPIIRGKSSTEPSLIKNKIPIKLIEEEHIKTPGFIEADTVAHCGTSLSGDFANSLTMTDLCSGWTENRATWTKKRKEVIKAIKSIERSLPFNITGFASDNGNEFFNHDLHDYFSKRDEEVEFVRRRAYKKNDNAHVEQKNWTHVRELYIDELNR